MKAKRGTDETILQNVSLFQDFYKEFMEEFMGNLLHFRKAALLYNGTSLLV